MYRYLKQQELLPPPCMLPLLPRLQIHSYVYLSLHYVVLEAWRVRCCYEPSKR